MLRTQRCDEDQWASMTDDFAQWMTANMSTPRPGGGRKRATGSGDDVLALEDQQRIAKRPAGAQELFEGKEASGSKKPKQSMAEALLVAAKKGQNQLTVVTCRLKKARAAMKHDKLAEPLVKKVDALVKEIALTSQAATEFQHIDATADVLKKWLLSCAHLILDAKKVGLASKAFA